MSASLPRRILMTADTVGGVWTYAMELCRALEEYGIEVALAVMGAPLTPLQSQEAACLSNTEVYQGAYKLEWTDSPWNDVTAAGEWLLGLESRLSPDLIHLNGYAHGALPWRVPTLVVGHSCVLSWWQAVKGVPAGQEWSTYRDYVEAGLRAAELVVAPSRTMLAALREHYGPLENVAVIPNGRDASSYDISEKENFIFAAGRLWDEAKNIIALESAARSLSWPVYIAGEEKGPFERDGISRTEQQRARRELAGSGARFLGRLAPEDVRSWLSRAAIYAFPAKYEPFGLSVLEAALAGCALILGDIRSLREIWGDSALYVPPSDLEAIRTTIEGLIKDGDLRTELAARARTRAGEYSVGRMARHYLKAYSALLQRKAKPEFGLEPACVS